MGLGHGTNKNEKIKMAADKNKARSGVSGIAGLTRHCVLRVGNQNDGDLA